MNTCPICRTAVVIPGNGTTVRCPSCGTPLKRKERSTTEVKKEVQSLQPKKAATFASVLEREERLTSPIPLPPALEVESDHFPGAGPPPRSNHESRRPTKTHRQFDLFALLDDIAGWFLFVVLALGAVFWLLNFAFGLFCLVSAKSVFHETIGMASITGSVQAAMLYAILWKIPAKRRAVRK